MTDDELIQLVQETPPEQLSLETIELLRQRMAESARVREALASQLRFDQLLSGALARVQVSVEKILAHGGARPTGGAWLGRVWGWGLASLVIAVALGAWAVNRFDGDEKPDVVAENRDGVPVEEPSPVPEKPRSDPAAMPAKPAPSSVEPPPSGVPPTAPPAVAPGPAVPGAPRANPGEPWTAMLKAPVRTFEDVAFDDLSLDSTATSPAMIDRWWQPERGNKRPVEQRNQLGVELRGLFKLRAPWSPGVAWRLQLANSVETRLHIWHGLDGVTLHHVEKAGDTWSAYATRRAANAPTPERLVFLGNDGDRYRRTGRGPIDLRYQDGMVVMTRGDVLLHAVPLAGAPEAVWLEGQTLVAGLALAPSQPVPLAKGPAAAGQPSLTARAEWKTDGVAASELKRREDGCLELVSTDAKQPAYVALPVEDPGFRELIFLIEGAQPGTGVFLGDAEGRPRCQVGYAMDRRTQRTLLGFTRPGDKTTEIKTDTKNPCLAFAGDKTWLKLVWGAGAVKCWISADGVHWARALAPQRGIDGGFATVGLYVLPGAGARSIALARLEAPRLAALDAWLPRAARDRAVDLSGVTDPGTWLQQALDAQPADVESTATWRRWCAGRALAGGASAEVARTLLVGLLADATDPALPLADRLRLLDELAVLADGTDPRIASAVAAQYVAIGEQLWRAGDLHPVSKIRRALLESPVGGASLPGLLPEMLVRAEVLQLVYAGKWSELQAFCRQMYLYGGRPGGIERGRTEREAAMRIVDWGDALAARNLPQDDGAPRANIPSSWRHPLVEQLGKEGFNVLAELDAALAGEAYKDACQIITSVTPQQAAGLLPNEHDAELLVSLPGAVALAMRDRPALRRTMQDDFGPLGQLRLRQAIDADDRASVAAVTTQFYGTPAAAEAHEWLGDRELARGDFVRAEGHYHAATQEAATAERGQIAARLRLVAAMQGRDSGAPVTEAVQLNDTVLEAAEFERLVTRVRTERAVRASDVEGGPSQKPQVEHVPPPQAYALRRWLPLEGEVGTNAGPDPTRDVDFIAAQTSMTWVSGMLIVSNRFQVSAFDTTKPERRWTAPLEGAAGRTHDWSAVPMRPLVAGKRLFVRRLLKDGPELTCLDIESGKRQWRSLPGDIVASDPVLQGGRLMALTIGPAQQETLQLSLSSYDPASGRLLGQQPLSLFRDVWQKAFACQLVVTGDSLLVLGGGCVLACDLEGNTRWLRRETWLGGVIDARSNTTRYSPPIVDGDRAIVSQPGVPSITCIELRTGRRIWQRVQPDVVRVLAKIEGRVLVETTTGLLSIDADSGRPAWFAPLENLRQAVLMDAHHVLVSQTLRTSAKEEHLALAWLDAHDGQLVARSKIEGWNYARPAVGPLMALDDRLFAVVGIDRRLPQRELVELLPQGGVPKAVTGDALAPAWTSHLVPELGAPDDILPGWTLIASQHDGKNGNVAELLGERGVFVTQASANHPAAWARRVTVPADGRTLLRVQAGLRDKDRWTLEILADGDIVASQPIEPETAPAGWRKLDVDLSRFAGRTVWLFARQVVANGPRQAGSWKRLDVETE